ncbi:MAG: hypothetical protein M5E90_06385 [Asgard group archaeon]|nr:hypothetical protein [Asgard group archaeon]
MRRADWRKRHKEEKSKRKSGFINIVGGVRYLIATCLNRLKKKKTIKIKISKLSLD